MESSPSGHQINAVIGLGDRMAMFISALELQTVHTGKNSIADLDLDEEMLVNLSEIFGSPALATAVPTSIKVCSEGILAEIFIVTDPKSARISS
jgi:hypothetical protein